MKSCYIDIHCHFERCSGKEAIARAQQAGVGIICTQGTDGETNAQSLVLAHTFPEVKACMGLYPIIALEMTDIEIEVLLKDIRTHARDSIAIGEVGMDFKDDITQHARQKEIFTKVVRLAQELDKPLIVHSRKAELACIELLEELEAKKVIMHCFCGKWSLAQRIIANGWYLTVPTSVTRSEQFQRYAKELPLTQLFCETDAPYLHPDKTVTTLSNEPAYVIASYEAIARLRGMKLTDVRDQLFANYQTLCAKR
ncbi:TatD family deoxyribonuclease [Candidatus Pacearchaeota archaeon]|nr:TatD family deoxyribonuclease [Candidatus Pacearchaeota archaeon]